jgi:hypothetical protein
MARKGSWTDRRCRGPASALLGVLLAASEGEAQTAPSRTYRLDWSRAPGTETCPEPSALAAAVSRHLVSSAIDPGAPRRVDAAVQRAASRFHVTLRLFDETGALQGSRSLTSESDSCAPVFESAAFAIALAIDPDAQAIPRAPEPEAVANSAEPQRAPPSRPIVLESRVPTLTPADGGGLRVDALSVAAATSTSVVPDLALGVTATSLVDFDLPFDGLAAAHFSPGASSVPTEGGRVRVGLAALTLGVAVPWALRRKFRPELFAGVSGGALTLGVRDARPVGGSARPFVGFQAGVGFRALLDEHFGIRASVHALVPLHRYRLFATGYPGLLWKQPGAGLMAEVGPVWVFSE